VSRKPPIKIGVVFDASQATRQDLVHRVENYGEDLWRVFRDEPRVMVSFDAIALDRFHFTATSSILAKRAAKVAEELLAKHNLIAAVTVSEWGHGAIKDGAITKTEKAGTRRAYGRIAARARGG
jgi:hypothetical protein